MEQKLVILGGGESGVGAALLGHAKGWQVFLSDSGWLKSSYKDQLMNAKIPFEEGGHTFGQLENASLVVKSPGIPDKAEVVLALKAKGIAVVSELEFAFRYTKAKFIGITGSNGKTTTTLLIFHLMKKCGFNVGLAGNVGESLAKQVLEDTFDWYVLEISSFQLDGMFDFHVDIAILTNITPDHLDRYEYKLANYVHSKFRIVRNQLAEDTFIYFAQDEISAPLVNLSLTQAQVLSVGKDGAFHGSWENEVLVFNLNGDAFKIAVNQLSLKGEHNYYNVLMAGLAVRQAGGNWESISDGLKDFVNAPHRLESISKINGIEFVNDSKATNVDSVKYALRSFEQPIVWIAGGVDKGNDYSLIASEVKAKVKALVTLGTDSTPLTHFFKNSLAIIVETSSISDAVERSFELANAGDVVLLSPACASFDLFKNYEDRGNQFRTKVLELATLNQATN